MCVGKRVILSVPAAKTNVEPADARAVIVNDYDFLMVGPKLDVICQIRNLSCADDTNEEKHLWTRYDPGGAYKQYLDEGPRELSR